MVNINSSQRNEQIVVHVKVLLYIQQYNIFIDFCRVILDLSAKIK